MQAAEAVLPLVASLCFRDGLTAAIWGATPAVYYLLLLCMLLLLYDTVTSHGPVLSLLHFTR